MGFWKGTREVDLGFQNHEQAPRHRCPLAGETVDGDLGRGGPSRTQRSRLEAEGWDPRGRRTC